jgi:hypothetical protein
MHLPGRVPITIDTRSVAMRALMPWMGMTRVRKEMVTITFPTAPEAKGTTIPVKAA